MTLGDEIILLLAGGGIAILGSLATSVANALRESRIRDEGRIAELNRDVSTGLAMARAVLDDANPDRVAFSANVALHQQLDDLKENWQPGRLALLAARDRHPDSDVRDLARSLAVAIDNLFIADRWLLDDVLEDHTTDYRRTAVEKHRAAEDAADKLAAKVRLQAAH